jgi:ADP-heptose:LPS heptosyltransferase
MKDAINRLARRAVNAAFSLVYAPPRPERLDPAGTRRVLVLRNDRLGDAVLSTGALRALKQLNPAMEVHVAASQVNRAFLARQAGVDQVHVLYTKKAKVSWRGLRNLATILRLRSLRFDAVLDLVHDNRKDSNPFLANLAARGALRSGYEKGRRPHQAFDRVVPGDQVKSRHAALEVQAIVENTFHLPEGFEFPTPAVAEEPEAARRMRAALDEAGVSGYVLVNVSAGDPRREYPEAKWGELLRAVLAPRPKLYAVATGPAFEADRLRRVCEAAGERCLALPSTLDECSELARGAEAVLTPDTSVVHLAAAHGTPVLGLYDDRHYKERVWRPFNTASRLVFPPEGGLVPDIAPAEAIRAFDELMQEA